MAVSRRPIIDARFAPTPVCGGCSTSTHNFCHSKYPQVAYMCSVLWNISESYLTLSYCVRFRSSRISQEVERKFRVHGLVVGRWVPTWRMLCNDSVAPRLITVGASVGSS